MNRIQPLIMADLQISLENTVCYIGKKEFEYLNRFGISISPLGSLIPAIRVDCFAQKNGEECDWTEGQLVGYERFPRYIPINILGCCTDGSRVQFQAKGFVVDVIIRDNFGTQSNFTEQLMDSLDKFTQNVSICPYSNKKDRAELIEELVKQGLIRKKLKETSDGIVTEENPLVYVHCPVSNRSAFEHLFNMQKIAEIAQQKSIKEQQSISDDERAEIVKNYAGANLFSYLRNREIGRR